MIATAQIAYENVFGIALVAFGAPLLVSLLRLPIPEVVAQIVAGIVLGPSGFGLIEVDQSVAILAGLGLAYLLFVSGLEISPDTLRGPAVGLVLRAFGLSVCIALAVALFCRVTDLIENVGFVVAAMITTSLGIVVTVLKEERRLSSEMGQITLFSAAIGDFVSVALLSVVFADGTQDATLKVVLIGTFALAAVLVVLSIMRLSVIDRLRDVFARKAGHATQLQVRGCFVLLTGFAALAAGLGLEAILGAFAAGVAVSVLDANAGNREEVRAKLEAIGFGLLAPIFFVASGLRFDLGALVDNSDGLLLIPVLFIGMVGSRALPSLLFRRVMDRDDAIASGLLLSTKLTFVVAAVEIGREAHAIRPSVASALIAAAIITVLISPTLAHQVLRREPRV